MMNRTILVGRLTRDPDLRYTPTGNAVANFTVAVNRPFKNQEGQQEADFVNCVTWRKQAENLANYQKKGNLIGVDGRVQTRTYEGQDGKTVYVTEILAESIQFLESKNNGNTGQNNQPGTNTQPNQQNNQNQSNFNNEDPFANNGQPIDISDDELPF
ncbi:single-stranded DNA-binding protein [Oceanobacillus sp. Castelsardo]|uniref:single-stranded DNA-binding protein n=1 Tax=Oceanobacillus sp. Castelsardo TaxID=1851204 RepID=UPI00083999B2|nr:single-stranded DNA-binding protein [Oceanobacillus sp. Castelsardo]